jgi:uncharacterized protein DUF3175
MSTRRSKRGRRRPAVNRWQQAVTRAATPLELEPGLFTRDDPREIARALLRAAQKKSAPARSAMAVLVFYINRSGKNLSKARRTKL